MRGWGLIGAVTLAALLSAGCRSAQPGSLDLATANKEREQVTVPRRGTSLATIFARLDGEEAEAKKGALLWLLRANRAEDLGWFAFPKHSLRVDVKQVTKKEVGGITWRLVECYYVMMYLDGSVRWADGTMAAYLFDDLGRLRDWYDGYDDLVADDFNQDGRIDIALIGAFSDFDLAKAFTLFSYDRGRSRYLLHLEPKPYTPDWEDRQPPLEIIEPPGGGPKSLKIDSHGTYTWNEAAQKYAVEEE